MNTKPPLQAETKSTLGITVPHVQVEGRSSVPVHNIYCIGRNYADHARELGNAVPQSEPVVFLKSSASLRDLESSKPMAFASDEFHHEVELVLLIGKTAPLNSPQILKHVSAFGLGLDLTRRQVQTELKQKGLPWTTAKSFTGSAIVAPLINEKLDEHMTEFTFCLNVNQELRQSGSTKDMIFNLPTLLTYINSFNVLHPGDLIFTGTPAGVGPIRRGDRFELVLDRPSRTWRGTL